MRCHYHGWTYGLDGKLVNAPEMESAADFSPSEIGLVPVSVEAWGPLIFVNLNEKAGSLNEWLGDIPERTSRYDLQNLVFTDRVEYTIKCNWKLYVENFLEGYHIPLAHPGLNQILDYRTYTVEDYDNYVLQYGTNKESGERSNPLVDFKKKSWEGAGEEAGSQYYWIFPNLMWNLSPDVVQSNVILPVSEEETRVVFDFYFDNESAKSEEIRQQNIKFSDEVQQEDIDICETVQRNLHSSSYDKGRYCPKRENGVYRFHNLMRQYLQDD